MANLNNCKKNSQVKLCGMPDSIRTNLIRMGLCAGDIVKCITKIPGGPVVVAKDLQEIAIGEEFAREIEVEEI